MAATRTNGLKCGRGSFRACRFLKACRYKIWCAENSLYGRATPTNFEAASFVFQALPDAGNLGLRKVQSSHGFCESGKPKKSCRERNSLMIYGACAKPECTAALCCCLDDIWTFFVFSEAVYDDCASIGKHSLYAKFAPYRVDIVSQSAQIHVRPLLDSRNRTLRYVSHLGQIGLGELPGAAEFVQGHTL